jgi:hypothetical protein
MNSGPGVNSTFARVFEVSNIVLHYTITHRLLFYHDFTPEVKGFESEEGSWEGREGLKRLGTSGVI